MKMSEPSTGMACASPARRRFLRQTAPALLGGLSLFGCSEDGAEKEYDPLAVAIRKTPTSIPRDHETILRELVRNATLAANSHNSQPWKFWLGKSGVTLAADFTRRCPAVDPDDHHLFASLGCATENLVVAASSHGLHAEVSLDELEKSRVRISLSTSKIPVSSLVNAIPRRQSTRAAYSGKPVPSQLLRQLEATAKTDGVDVWMFTAKEQIENILEFVVAGNTVQMRDKAFMQELKQWVRFNELEALTHRDGLYAGSSGNPIVPGWLGRVAFEWAFNEESENNRYREHIRSSSGLIVLSSTQDNRASWFDAGRSVQRLCLQATALGLKHAFVNQPVEVAAIREQFSSYLGLTSGRPDLLIRFGYGPDLPLSLRRSVSDVIGGYTDA